MLIKCCFHALTIFLWAGCHLAPAVYPAGSRGWGGDGQRSVPGGREAQGTPGCQGRGAWVPWELGGAILGATEPAGVGVGESERRGWCGFFSSRFQTAFLFFHTETIKALKQGFGTKLKRVPSQPHHLVPFYWSACSLRLTPLPHASHVSAASWLRGAC